MESKERNQLSQGRDAPPIRGATAHRPKSPSVCACACLSGFSAAAVGHHQRAKVELVACKARGVCLDIPIGKSPRSPAGRVRRVSVIYAGRAAAIDRAAVPRTLVGSLEMSSPSAQQHGGEAATARARLRWTRPLHERFVLAVSELGGADRESIKSSRTQPELATKVYISDDDRCLIDWHCRSDAQVGAEGHGRAGAHPLPSQEPPPGAVYCCCATQGSYDPLSSVNRELNSTSNSAEVSAGGEPRPRWQRWRRKPECRPIVLVREPVKRVQRRR